MTRSVEDQVAEMLAEIQQQRPDPLEDTENGHIPASAEPAAETRANEREDTEAIHVFFVRESEVQRALLDAQSVEAEPEAKAQPQPVTTRKNAPRTNTVLSVGMFTVCLLLSILLLMLFIVPQFFVPSATVTITPKTATVATTATIKVHGRLLPSLTLSQSLTTSTTGKRHQDAAKAHGTITFYNGLFTSQTIGAGTILTGAEGVQVITDQAAVIPAAQPPIFGQTTVMAHAVSAGEQGNIRAYDINTACCTTSVLAKNTTAFTGGESARDYLVVTKSDLASAAESIRGTLEKSERAALNAQLNSGEALTPPLCSEKIISDHRIGDEAKQVMVTVSQTCSNVAYDAHMLYLNATQTIHQQAKKRFGTGYIPLGDTQVAIVHAITDHTKGIAALTVKLDVTYVYQLTPGEKQQFVKLIAGKPKQQAEALLLQCPGIAGAQISVKGGNQTLPENPGAISIVVVERL